MGRSECNNEKSYNKCDPREGLTVFHTTNHSLGNKINELRAITASETPDVSCISVSLINLHYKHFKAEYVVEGYRDCLILIGVEIERVGCSYICKGQN